MVIIFYGQSGKMQVLFMINAVDILKCKSSVSIPRNSGILSPTLRLPFSAFAGIIAIQSIVRNIVIELRIVPPIL